MTNLERVEANLADAVRELEDAKSRPQNTKRQKTERLWMIEAKAENLAHHARMASLHLRESEEGVVA